MVVKGVEYNTALVRWEYNKPVKSGGGRYTSVVVYLFPLCKYLDENCHHILTQPVVFILIQTMVCLGYCNSTGRTRCIQDYNSCLFCFIHLYCTRIIRKRSTPNENSDLWQAFSCKNDSKTIIQHSLKTRNKYFLEREEKYIKCACRGYIHWIEK